MKAQRRVPNASLDLEGFTVAGFPPVENGLLGSWSPLSSLRSEWQISDLRFSM